jgi:SAM-dependent methyltransferase
MDDLDKQVFDIIKETGFVRLILTKPINKSEAVRIDLERKGIVWQFSCKFRDGKIRHINANEYQPKLSEYIPKYREFNVISETENVNIAKGNKSIRTKREKRSAKAAVQETHDRKKNHITDGNAKWLAPLGITGKKFRQINRFAELFNDMLKRFPVDSFVNVIDIGCGKSYLAFAIAELLNSQKRPSMITGIDVKQDVIEKCLRLKEQYNFGNMEFVCGDISKQSRSLTKPNAVNIVLSLHACDTASDMAIYHAIKNACDGILCVPCCHNELSAQIANDEHNILLKHGIIHERFASLLTDALRAEILSIHGYETTVMEFIGYEDTPKNIMIKAVKGTQKQEKTDNINKLNDLCGIYNVKPSLRRWLYDE